MVSTARPRTVAPVERAVASLRFERVRVDRPFESAGSITVTSPGPPTVSDPRFLRLSSPRSLAGSMVIIATRRGQSTAPEFDQRLRIERQAPSPPR